MDTLTHPRPRVNRKPRPKPSRTARVSPVGESGRRILNLAQGKQAWVYWLDEVPCDFGRGFQLEKFTDGAVYAVHLDVTGDSCTCLGHLRHGHRTVCKHIASVKALIGAGRL
jgi:hypothetical protein